MLRYFAFYESQRHEISTSKGIYDAQLLGADSFGVPRSDAFKVRVVLATNETPIPQTSGTRSSTPFFGRSYQLTVIPATKPDEAIIISGDEYEPESLRFTFEVEQVAYASGCAWWQAQVEIYNCDGVITYGPSKGKSLVAELMSEGSMVIVQAGYQADGKPQTIWEGPVFQTIWERVDVVDFKLTLRCLLNRDLTTLNHVGLTLQKVTKANDQARLIAAKSVTPIQIDEEHLKLLDAISLPRAKTVFGNPHRFLTSLAKSNGLSSWFTQHKFAMAQLGSGGAKPLAFGPPSPLGPTPIRQPDGTTLSIIGSPQQTQFGITFRVLLDSRLQIVSPLVRVAVQMQYIRQAPIQFPVQVQPRPLAVNYYTVVGVRHCGDTRGNSWYTEVTAIVSLTAADLLAYMKG